MYRNLANFLKIWQKFWYWKFQKNMSLANIFRVWNFTKMWNLFLGLWSLWGLFSENFVKKSAKRKVFGLGLPHLKHLLAPRSRQTTTWLQIFKTILHVLEPNLATSSCGWLLVQNKSQKWFFIKKELDFSNFIF
jgi:hypothetical protein